MFSVNSPSSSTSTGVVYRPKVERRLYERRIPSTLESCQIFLPELEQWLDGHVQNLSPRGMAVIVAREFKPGTRLAFRMINYGSTFCLHATLCVLRSERLPSSDWFLAGEFERLLQPDELLPFLL